jgi:predicted ATPase
MLITNLSVENLKSFGERQEAPLADITLVYGPNSAGKSTLIQALLLLKQTMDAAKEYRAYLVARGPFVDLGSFSALVYQHDIEKPVVIGVTGLFDPEVQYPPPPNLVTERRKAKMAYKFTWDEKFQSATHHSTSIEFDEKHFVFERIKEFITDVSAKNVERERSGAFRLIVEDDALPRYFVSEDMLPGQEIVRVYGELYNDDLQVEFGEPELADDTSPRHFDIDIRNPTWNEQAKNIEERADFVRRKYQQERKQYEHILDLLAWLIPSHYDPRDTFHLPWQIRDNFRSIIHIGPVRSVPERFHILSDNDAVDVGPDGANIIEAIIHGEVVTANTALEPGWEETKDDPVANNLRMINRWLEIFNVPYSIEIQPIRADFVGNAVALTLLHRQSKVRVSMADVGYGVSQILPIIVQCCLSERSILCIEQPELHIHPKLQADMADLLIDCVALSERFNWSTVLYRDAWSEEDESVRSELPDDQVNLSEFSRLANAVTGLEDIYNQVIVETHSEHLLLRLQRRIREGKIRNTNVSVLYVDPLPDGSSIIRTIRLDEDGSMIDEWPGGFFEERYNEMFGR